ncbi:MAG: hypothetical protein FWC76_02730 [Defluviitaleaceae bacterium]|nr:hypothetical protein [Defluviitaleaceae bacterium]
MMIRDGWQKLPYPKFLEVTAAQVLRDGKQLWQGKCIFTGRKRVKKQSDGQHSEVAAVATTSKDLTGILGEAHDAGLVFCAKGRQFDVLEVLPAHNPDGSFHHTSVSLRERAGDGNEVCAQPEYGEADYAEGPRGLVADCP